MKPKLKSLVHCRTCGKELWKMKTDLVSWRGDCRGCWILKRKDEVHADKPVRGSK